MTVELNNESGESCDEGRLASLAEHALRELRIHPQAELSVLLVDEDTMSAYHERWMDEPGPTDVLSFPMDELRPPSDDEEPPEGMLGDVVLCPVVAARQAAGAVQAGHAGGSLSDGGSSARPTMQAELEYLLVHGILHLLGFDHATPSERSEMFGLTDALIAAWRPHS